MTETEIRAAVAKYLRDWGKFDAYTRHFMENTTKKEISLETQLYCARREFALRERCYPKWVAQARMSSAKAAHELEVMAAIVETLHGLCHGSSE